MSDDGPVKTAIEDGLAVARIDDGKVNAISPAALAQLDEALSRAETDAAGLVIAGRPGMFSAGFDLSVMRSGVQPMRALVRDGAEFLLRLYESPLPVVAACTGHAMAMGALILLASDTRIGPEADAKIALNEVAVGMGLPVFAVELARDRLAPPVFQAATIQAQVFEPGDAVAAGYLDRTVAADQVEAEAISVARQLAELRRGAVAHTKARVRGATLDHIRSTLDDDMTTVGMPPLADAR